MKVLITGATGFIGRALTSHLVQLGHQVTILARHPLEIDGVEVVEVPDITLVTDAHIHGQEVVIHLAGQAHDNIADEASYRHVNVMGTEAVARSCVQGGVERLVFVSSVKVHGDDPGERLNAGSPTRADDAYGLSKLRAEEIVQAQSGLESVIVRIPLVYGEGVKGNFATLVRLVNTGLPLPFKSVTARRSYVGIDNLVDLLALTIDSPDAIGKVLYACDRDPLSLPELLRVIAQAQHRSVRLIAIPPRILRLMTNLVLGPRRSNKLFNGLEIDLAGTMRQIGWSPPFTTAECLQRMFGDPAQY